MTLPDAGSTPAASTISSTPEDRHPLQASVADDLEEIEPSMARRIVNKIERALRNEGKCGKPLAGEFAGMCRLRIKDDRVIYARTTDGYLVLRIGHRREVYEKAP